MRYTAQSALYSVICQCNRYYALYSTGHSIQCNMRYTAQGESYSTKCLTDWSVLGTLPKTVQKLSLCSLHLQRFDHTNTDKPTLQAFNTLVNLVELNLIFQGNFEEVPDYNSPLPFDNTMTGCRLA